MRDAQLDKILRKSRIDWDKVGFYLLPRPRSGKIWLDVIFLLFVAGLEQAFFADGLFGVIAVDLVSPWVIAAIVLQTFPGALIMSLTGATILETSTVAPAGMYLCAFFMITVTIQLIKNSLSWRHRTPWAFTMATAMLWLVLFESFVLAITRSPERLGFVYCISQTGRLVIATGFAYLLAIDWIRSLNAEDPER